MEATITGRPRRHIRRPSPCRNPLDTRTGGTIRAMAAGRRIGILTGGGDVPGLNSVIKSVVYGATADPGVEVIGIRRGGRGLTDLAADGSLDHDFIIPLNRENTRTVERTGGTFLHSSRTNP